MTQSQFKSAWQSAFTLTTAFVSLLRLLALLGLISTVILIYAVWFEQPFIRYQNLPFPVKEPVQQGRTVPILVERCNDSDRERAYMSSLELVNVDNKKKISLPNSTIAIPPGCDRVETRSIIIPQETPVGSYTINGETMAQGIIKMHRIEWYTEPFKVVPTSDLTKQLAAENASDRRKVAK